MYFIFLLISFMASVAGAICGIGGGVIIKPVLDATGLMGVSSISFLSGCTVLSMSVISVFKSMKRGNTSVNIKIATPLAVGAAIGGILGKALFQYAYDIFPDENKVGAVQAMVLVLITLGTLIYTINVSKIKTHKLENSYLCIIIGLLLGLLSAFLGIGGGPINIILLSYFFTMDTKQAAINSLYIIMFSQFASLISTMIHRTIPDFEPPVLILMVSAGITGAMVGQKINKKYTAKDVDKLFMGLMMIIVFINIYNVIKFLL
ncbi:sulfite exporter TauE/SafE family protein [Anaerocolumna sp. MB42-C2]|uniref:sulfite exporter TauE/SafE family protein n=1 Tax=Anaerocolumna sp. MB42-C2 TaxID=3070997 RepID=UPI0027E15818|nr:sulfite exporter TauE/SafE family protein [Anaerocolumna sp. MB42-C2]WMJ86622.1 sulfite exporter TauE/SafE family protein [Anaerocolumna sp. MB42-C2]